MKVHFSASLKDLEKHIADYQIIVDAIKDSGNELLSDWLQKYHGAKAASKDFTDEEWKRIDDQTLTSVQDADAVIIEASLPSFNMGYLAAKTLTLKKPLLVLYNKHPQPYVFNSTSALKRSEIYRNDKELQQSVTTFLKDIDVDAKNLRFNMVLDRETYNYLNWESTHTGKTKAQVIREILREQIHKGSKSDIE